MKVRRWSARRACIPQTATSTAMSREPSIYRSAPSPKTSQVLSKWRSRQSRAWYTDRQADNFKDLADTQRMEYVSDLLSVLGFPEWANLDRKKALQFLQTPKSRERLCSALMLDQEGEARGAIEQLLAEGPLSTFSYHSLFLTTFASNTAEEQGYSCPPNFIAKARDNVKADGVFSPF